MALKKFCNKQGCKNLIDITERYCPQHIHIQAEAEAARQKRYDQTVRHGRDASLSTFYGSTEWEAKRAYIINQYDGVDIYAYYIHHRIETATMVHHIHPLRTHWNLRLDDENLIPLSAHSHGEVEQLYKTKAKETKQLLFDLLYRWRIEFHSPSPPNKVS